MIFVLSTNYFPNNSYRFKFSKVTHWPTFSSTFSISVASQNNFGSCFELEDFSQSTACYVFISS